MGSILAAAAIGSSAIPRSRCRRKRARNDADLKAEYFYKVDKEIVP